MVRLVGSRHSPEKAEYQPCPEEENYAWGKGTGLESDYSMLSVSLTSLPLSVWHFLP
jgi:hypothetical protein